MVRIQIKDLPTVTNLHAEELEEIFGAGRFSFKPAFEDLGAREMMDAGLGGALMASPVTSQELGNQVGLVGMQNPGTPDTQGQVMLAEDRVFVGSLEARPPQSLASRDIRADGQKIFDEVKSRFVKDMITPTPIINLNRWGLQDVKGNSDFTIEGTTIKVHLRVGYGMYNHQSDKHKVMDVYYTFSAQDTRGGATVYRLTNATHSGYQGAFEGSLDSVGRNVMRGDFIGTR